MIIYILYQRGPSLPQVIYELASTIISPKWHEEVKFQNCTCECLALLASISWKLFLHHRLDQISLITRKICSRFVVTFESKKLIPLCSIVQVWARNMKQNLFWSYWPWEHLKTQYMGCATNGFKLEPRRCYGVLYIVTGFCFQKKNAENER